MPYWLFSISQTIAIPDGAQVQRLVKIADIRRASPRQAQDTSSATNCEASANPGRQRQMPADDSVPAPKCRSRSQCIERPCRRSRRWSCPHLAMTRLRIHPARQREAVIAVGSDDVSRSSSQENRADAGRFLPGRCTGQKAADHPCWYSSAQRSSNRRSAPSGVPVQRRFFIWFAIDFHSC